jgi:hypothetical protein
VDLAIAVVPIPPFLDAEILAGAMSDQRYPVGSRGYRYSCGAQWLSAVAAWLAPEWPGVTVAQAQALVRGESPEQISGGVLTETDASRWLHHDPQTDPALWLERLRPAREWESFVRGEASL